MVVLLARIIIYWGLFRGPLFVEPPDVPSRGLKLPQSIFSALLSWGAVRRGSFVTIDSAFKRVRDYSGIPWGSNGPK